MYLRGELIVFTGLAAVVLCGFLFVPWKAASFEPRYEKTGLRGFRPDHTQTLL